MSEFFGIVIALYYADHAPPHFHARYGEEEAVFAIDGLDVLRGSIPRRAHALVLEWASSRKGDLRANWERAGQVTAARLHPPLD
ncbi:DUF4160 domain-containing protein [Anaeromyxobacter oryzisoli]|uniref:DUF4160 domain-containing protein n=1 Tax=Anaeromyxobacter oryzisoli TaxID=2925408 RepID=UPI001F55F2DA|nr:DUF4160 domain-containing protein [Anaeromyxobacter sp. SG63]